MMIWLLPKLRMKIVNYATHSVLRRLNLNRHDSHYMYEDELTSMKIETSWR